MKRKPRADAKLIGLPLEVQREIIARLDKESQLKVRDWLSTAHDVVVSPSTLTVFYQWWHSERQLEQLAEESSRFRETLQAMQRAGELNVSDDSISTLGQAFFEHQALREEDPKAYAIIKARRQRDRELVLKERAMADRERRTALLEQEAAKAMAAAKVTADAGLSPEEKARKYREIFGIA